MLGHAIIFIPSAMWELYSLLVCLDVMREKYKDSKLWFKAFIFIMAPVLVALSLIEIVYLKIKG